MQQTLMVSDDDNNYSCRLAWHCLQAVHNNVKEIEQVRLALLLMMTTTTANQRYIRAEAAYEWNCRIRNQADEFFERNLQLELAVRGSNDTY